MYVLFCDFHLKVSINDFTILIIYQTVSGVKFLRGLENSLLVFD